MSEMLERILSDENIKIAYKRVCANKGAVELQSKNLKSI